jgi:hypothetical protein
MNTHQPAARESVPQMLTSDEAAELLSVPYETLSEYVGAGLLSRIRDTNTTGGRRYLYNLDDLIAFDARFPQDAYGRRQVKTRHRADRNIVRRRCTDGRLRYTARVKYRAEGREVSRTFATLETARKWRDRMEAERDGTTPDHFTPAVPHRPPPRWWARLLTRSADRPWEVAS